MTVGLVRASARLRRPVTALLIVSAAGLAGAQAPPQSMIESALRSVRDDQLEIKVGLSLTQTEPFTNWNTQQSELTIPGRAVNVEVNGSNLRIRAVFTPYLGEDGELELVAQGQVWLDDGPEAPTRYVATYRSVPLSLGEKLLFFPLGVAEGVADEVTLKLEVEIVRYEPERSRMAKTGR
jgi:hypothetical protein